MPVPPSPLRLVVEGEANDDFFMLLEGPVSVAVGDRGEVRVLGSGEMIGEMSLIDARPFSATVTALEDCYVLRLSHQRLRARAASDLGFGMRLYRALATFLAQQLRRERRLAFSEETGLVEDEGQEAEPLPGSPRPSPRPAPGPWGSDGVVRRSSARVEAGRN